MAEVESAPAPAKAAKKAASKPKKAGPSVNELILEALGASQERSGMSATAVKKALSAGGYDVERNKTRVNVAIKRLVEKGLLVQTKGTGASGSFKVNKKAPEPKAKKPAKEVAAKAKKPAAKKVAAAKKAKPAVAKKPAAAKKSIKAKKPAAAKTTPRKAVKSTKKSPMKSPKKAAPKNARLAKKPKVTAAKKVAKKVSKPVAKKGASKKK